MDAPIRQVARWDLAERGVAERDVAEARPGRASRQARPLLAALAVAAASALPQLSCAAPQAQAMADEAELSGNDGGNDGGTDEGLERVALDGTLVRWRHPERKPAPRQRLERSLLPAPARAETAGGVSVPSQQWMSWRRSRGFEWGVGMVVPSPGMAGPWSGQRAAETTALPATAQSARVPTRAVLGVGRGLGAGLSLQLDLSTRLPQHVTAGGAGPAGLMQAVDHGGLPLAPDAASAPPEWRVGLAFHSRDEGEVLRRGLGMKMSLGSGSTLSIKPRARRVVVQLSSQW